MNRKIISVVIIVIGIAAGIFTIGTAVSYLRDQEIKSMLESDTMKKAVSQSDEAMESFNRTMTDTNKVLCDSLLREYYKDPQGMSLIMSLSEILNSDECKNKIK